MKIFGDHFCIHCFKNTLNDIHIVISETISVRDSFRLKGKSPFFKKFKFFVIGGWQPSKRIKDGVNIFRSFDKENDSYIEIVKNYKTGRIIHKSKDGEKLSEHTKHGSAKTD